MSAVDQSGNAKDTLPVYSMVNKSMKKKKVDSHEEAKSTSDDRSRLYSKVDKSKKLEVSDVQPADSDNLSTRCDITDDIPGVENSEVTTQSSEIHEANFAASNAGYESIKLNGPPKDAEECGYDTVGEDFGYDSVDVVAENDGKNCVPSLAMLTSAMEHVYDVVPENPSELRRLSTDYEDIREISLCTQ